MYKHLNNDNPFFFSDQVRVFAVVIDRDKKIELRSFKIDNYGVVAREYVAPSKRKVSQ